MAALYALYVPYRWHCILHFHRGAFRLYNKHQDIYCSNASHLQGNLGSEIPNNTILIMFHGKAI